MKLTKLNENKTLAEYEKEWEEQNGKTCDNCGTKLNDGGTCPKCDDGEESLQEKYTKDEMVDKLAEYAFHEFYYDLGYLDGDDGIRKLFAEAANKLIEEENEHRADIRNRFNDYFEKHFGGPLFEKSLNPNSSDEFMSYKTAIETHKANGTEKELDAVISSAYNDLNSETRLTGPEFNKLCDLANLPNRKIEVREAYDPQEFNPDATGPIYDMNVQFYSSLEKAIEEERWEDAAKEYCEIKADLDQELQNADKKPIIGKLFKLFAKPHLRILDNYKRRIPAEYLNACDKKNGVSTESTTDKFYIDVRAYDNSGRDTKERHSFNTLEELKQYVKDADLTEYEIVKCGGCDVEDLPLDSSLSKATLRWIKGKRIIDDDKKNENLTESISDPNVDLKIDGFDFEITDTFEDEGVKGYNVVYSKNDTPIVEIEIWEEDSPITVVDNLFAMNLFNKIYDSFDSFSADLENKIRKYKSLNEAVIDKFYIDEIVPAQGGKTETERHSFDTIEELKQYVKDANLTPEDIENCGKCDIKDLFEECETNEALGVGAGLALGGAAIGAGMVGSALLDSLDKDEEGEDMDELFDIKVDAKGFGGSGNNVHVGPGSMPLTASLNRDKKEKHTRHYGKDYDDEFTLMGY